MTHLCFEANMSLRCTGWRRRLLLGCYIVKYVSERSTGIHLHPEAVVTCTAVQSNDKTCSTRGSQSPWFCSCTQAVLIIIKFLLRFSLVTNKAVMLNTTNFSRKLLQSCYSKWIAVERNYLCIKGKSKNKPKSFFVFVSKLGIVCASSSFLAEQ